MGTLPAPCWLLFSPALAVIYFLNLDMRVWAQNHVIGPPPCSPHMALTGMCWGLASEHLGLEDGQPLWFLN